MLPIVDAAAGIVSGVIKPVLDKFIVDADVRLQAEQLAVQHLQALNLSQVEVNKVEAASQSLFVSGWRPFVGWVCGGSFAYALVGREILNWILSLVSAFTDNQIPLLPVPDKTIILEILFALLGFGGFRTYEKIQGVVK